MKNKLEPIHPAFYGLLVFVITLAIFSFVGIYMNYNTDLFYLLSIFWSIFFGISIAANKYRWRNHTIKVSFKNKEEFMKKIDTLLFQLGYTQENSKNNFFVYKRGNNITIAKTRISVTLYDKEAEINGPKPDSMKLQNALI